NDGKAIVLAVKDGGVFTRDIDGKTIELTEDDVLISVQNREGFSAESDGETTVVLDTELTPALILEGVERELVSKIQTMRKEAGFEVVDHIEIGYEAEGLALQVLEDGSFAKDVLCDKLSTNVDGFTKSLDINGNKVTISVMKIG
ncbi:MAG: isoleucine--tRNA ligase, partial [Clostridia bacterium]|nr:isoleucine--tRNA ligase [Clostridia bacterium]